MDDSSSPKGFTFFQELKPAHIPTTRPELIYLLNKAAEIEHALCCQYLYAVFSLKRNVNEGLSWEQLNYVNNWAQILYMIARQEMEHLGLVCNLLTSVGGVPNFNRMAFPQQLKYYPECFSLERFSEASLKQFIRFEQPPTLDSSAAIHFNNANLPQEVEAGLVPFETIGDLYLKIAWAIEEIPLSDEALFIGPPTAQVNGFALNLNFPRVGSLGGVYDLTLFDITSRSAAFKAIELIIEQGEGLSKTDPFSHYNRLQQILAELQLLKERDPNFDPARPVISNPYLAPFAPGENGTPITNPMARGVVGLFNSAYEILLLILTRFYAHTNETPTETEALMYTLFPMMTMVLRPLSEVVVTLPPTPLDTGKERVAGVSFELDRPIQFLPHNSSAWAYLTERLQNLGTTASDLARQEAAPERLGYIAESIELIASKFTRLINIGEDNQHNKSGFMPGSLL